MWGRFGAGGKKLCFGFVDLKRAFGGHPREVIRWAMREMGGGVVGVDSYVYVYCFKNSCKNMEALSREFTIALPWELLYTDDLVVMAGTDPKLGP